MTVPCRRVDLFVREIYFRVMRTKKRKHLAHM